MPNHPWEFGKGVALLNGRNLSSDPQEWEVVIALLEIWIPSRSPVFRNPWERERCVAFLR